jgi:MFS transporter, PAT family, beta-lactamase induction signal transducer AmpG
VKTRDKLLLLGSLYLSQGLPYGFFTQALPVLLRTQGMSLPKISLASLLALPWAFKFLWAPFIDAVQAPRLGRRRAVILPLQLLAAAVLAALALAGSAEATALLFVGVLLTNLCAATQDIATDGLAVELLTPDERGLGNGLQVGAYRVGMIVGGGVMLWVFARSGWGVAFLGLAGLLLAASVPVLLYRETSAVAVKAPRLSLGLLKTAFLRPGLLAWTPVLLLFKSGEWFATGMLRTFLSDSGQTLAELGTLLGLVGSGAGFLGAMLGGGLTARLGRRRALVAFGLLQSAGIASFAYATVSPTPGVFYAVTLAEHLTSGMATAALFTAMMDFSREEEAGTDYTVQASLVVISTGVTSALSGLSAQRFGYGTHFLLAAGLSLLGVAAVLLYRPSHPELVLLPARQGSR